MSRLVEALVFLCMWPLLLVGWLAGFTWKGLECGFWYACRYIDEASER